MCLYVVVLRVVVCVMFVVCVSGSVLFVCVGVLCVSSVCYGFIVCVCLSFFLFVFAYLLSGSSRAGRRAENSLSQPPGPNRAQGANIPFGGTPHSDYRRVH